MYQNTPGHESRKPDMSPNAATAMKAVLREVATEENAWGVNAMASESYLGLTFARGQLGNALTFGGSCPHVRRVLPVLPELCARASHTVVAL